MTFKLNGVENLFPVPLWQYSVEGHETLNPRLIDEIKARRASDKDISNRNRRGWQSQHDFFDRTEPAHAELAQTVREVLFHALKSIASEIKPEKLVFSQNGWVNVNPTNGYVGPHVHPNSLISGTYYVKVPKEEDAGGAIEFIAPHPVGHWGGFIKSPALTDKCRIQPTPGLILLFPGQLMHWVLPNNSKEDRITISFNLSVRLKPGTRL